jgi:hypothetical protein
METLFPEREVTAKGEVITISPLFFGQFPKAMKCMRPLFESVKESKIFFAEANGKEVKIGMEPDWPLKIPLLIEKGGEALIDFVGLCVGKPRDWFDTLPGDEGIRLTKAVFEINSDFFNARILPMLQAMGVVNPGAASSPISSEPVIAETTSTDTPSDS